MELVDIVVTSILILLLWKPFEWVTTKLVLKAIRIWKGMDNDVEEISDALDETKKCGSTCRCGKPCDRSDFAAKKNKPKKGA